MKNKTEIWTTIWEIVKTILTLGISHINKRNEKLNNQNNQNN